jgi:hypothetical protein
MSKFNEKERRVAECFASERAANNSTAPASQEGKGDVDEDMLELGMADVARRLSEKEVELEAMRAELAAEKKQHGYTKMAAEEEAKLADERGETIKALRADLERESDNGNIFCGEIDALRRLNAELLEALRATTYLLRWHAKNTGSFIADVTAIEQAEAVIAKATGDALLSEEIAAKGNEHHMAQRAESRGES